MRNHAKIKLDEIRKHLEGKQVKTRFAPSPTGFLHLGHVASAIYVWGIAELLNAEVIFRIEDHDRGRSRPEYLQAIIDDLTWLGFIDSKTTLDVLQKTGRLQSAANLRYDHALGKLDSSLLFFCECSRKDIREINSDSQQYPGTCLPKHLGPPPPPRSLRMQLADKVFLFNDALKGPSANNPHTLEGAAILKDKQEQWSYTMAVVTDDIQEGVNLVIRGEDLFEATFTQLNLYEAFEVPPPLYLHHPLIKDERGQKLSKRFLSEGVIKRRQAKEPAARVLGEAAYLVGLQPLIKPLRVSDLKGLFLSTSS